MTKVDKSVVKKKGDKIPTERKNDAGGPVCRPEKSEKKSYG